MENNAPLKTQQKHVSPIFETENHDTRLYVGDCREIMPLLPDHGNIDLIFADPPFNWDVPYGGWEDNMPRGEYEKFTFERIYA